MKIKLIYNSIEYKVDLSSPIDISIPLAPDGPICFHAPKVRLEPVEAGDFIGDVSKGSPVNFFNVMYNPHGNGTHTETNGHISFPPATINQTLKQFHFIAKVITIQPSLLENGDKVITKELIFNNLEKESDIKALIIRTLPNDQSKQTRNYSDTNPPYIEAEAMKHIVACGIEHLLLDLPSVDREQDGGMLIAHHIFWDSRSASRSNCTITEMIFIEESVNDGIYLLNLMIGPLELDAVSSKPVLFSLETED